MLSLQNKKEDFFFLNNYSVLLILCLVTLARVIALFFSPIELSVDEDQYWQWSKILQWGYFTKPPIIAWTIALSTSIFGQEEWAVRLCSPIIHFLISILLWIASQSFFDSKSGRVAALIWISTPVASLGSFIISTDTPLLLFWSFAIIFLIKLIKTRKVPYSILIGITIGLGFLSKYAALFFLMSLGLWWLIYDRGKILEIKSLILIILFTFIVASGNLHWNYMNDFATIIHTISNADLKSVMFNFKNMIEFLSSQLLVFGPILFLLYIFFVYKSFYKNTKLSLLAMLSLPIIFLIIIQSFLKIANANWAVSAYIAATILLSAYVVINKIKCIRLIFKIGLFVNVAISIFILNVTATGSFYPINLKSNPIRKNLGFELLAEKIQATFQKEEFSSIIFETRSDISRFNYYLNRFDNNFKDRIFLITENNIPGNYYEANYKFENQFFNLGNKTLLVSQSKEKRNYEKLSDVSLLKDISVQTLDKIEKKYYLYTANIIKN